MNTWIQSPGMFFTWLKATLLAIALLGQSIPIPRPVGLETTSSTRLKTLITDQATDAGLVKVSLQPQVRVVGGDEAELGRLDAALARFTSRGMRLPDLTVRFSEDDAECNGHLGLFQQNHSPWRLIVCSDLEFVVTHELAHAWEAANLTPVDRDRYLGFRDLNSWNSHEVPWKERGEEDAAFVMTKVLMAAEGAANSRAWRDLENAFTFLTESQPTLPKSSGVRASDSLRPRCHDFPR